MADEKPAKAPPRSYVSFPSHTWPFSRRRAYFTPEALEALKKDHPEAFLEANSVRPDRVQIDGRWYALELPDEKGRRWLVGLG